MHGLVLASASKARSAMLRNAGLEIEARPARVDEAAIKAAMLSRGAEPSEIAMALARAKAEAVPVGRGTLVIGADQVLVHGGRLYDKPRSMLQAAEHLRTLRASAHRLISAVSVARDGRQIWSVTASADLIMRDFSDAFLQDYLDRFGEHALTSVGAYHLEGLGAQLFDRVDGDYFTILGLPLLELLAFLRLQGILAE